MADIFRQSISPIAVLSSFRFHGGADLAAVAQRDDGEQNAGNSAEEQGEHMQQNIAVQIAEHAVELEGDVVVQIRRDPVHSKTDDLHGGLCHDDDGEEHRRERCGAGFDSCLICGVQCGDDAALQDNGQRTAAGHDKDDVFFAGKVEAEEILGAVKQQIDQQERQLKCLEDDAEDGRRAQAIQPAGRDLRAAASAGPCSRPHADDGQQLRQPVECLQGHVHAARAFIDGRQHARNAAGNDKKQIQQVQRADDGQRNGGQQVGQRPAAARQGMGIGRRMGGHELHGRRADLLHDNRDRLCALHGLLHRHRRAAGRAETGGGVVRRSAFRTKHGKSPSVRFCLQYNETGAPCQCVLYENAFLLA